MKEIIFSTPTCYKCESYIDNTRKQTAVHRLRGRSLYSGEQYCTYDKIVQFPKTFSGHYSKCPRKHACLQIHVYIRGPALDDDFSLFRNTNDNPRVASNYESRRYIYRHTTSTLMKARKFYEALSGYGDQYEMLGYFDPNIYDIIELDNGISSDFLILLPMRKWEKIYPVKEAMQRGQIGNFLVSAHDNWLLERYRIGTAASDCCGYIRGHFGSGPLRSDWVSLSNTSPAPKATKELEGFLFTLQTEGFLKSIKDMEEYCGIRSWASLPGEEKKVFGFHCSATEYHYFLRFDANEDSSYNVYIFCYPLRN